MAAQKSVIQKNLRQEIIAKLCDCYHELASDLDNEFSMQIAEEIFSTKVEMKQFAIRAFKNTMKKCDFKKTTAFKKHLAEQIKVEWNKLARQSNFFKKFPELKKFTKRDIVLPDFHGHFQQILRSINTEKDISSQIKQRKSLEELCRNLGRHLIDSPRQSGKSTEKQLTWDFDEMMSLCLFSFEKAHSENDSSSYRP